MRSFLLQSGFYCCNAELTIFIQNHNILFFVDDMVTTASLWHIPLLVSIASFILLFPYTSPVSYFLTSGIWVFYSLYHRRYSEILGCI
jgi:Na+-transporting NADH:ubiquinone oxidoreductase subunit NqrB